MSSVAEEKTRNLAPKAKIVEKWMGAFGEGLAMLAAAGGPDIDPQAASSAAEKARWDRDMAHFNEDMLSVQQFFLDILNEKLKSDAEINQMGFSFFGEQGPWYTVGYKMSVIVERRYGRGVLIDCMLDRPELLRRYNAAAAELNKKGANLPLWSPQLFSVLKD